jgi:hypothetical protein
MCAAQLEQAHFRGEHRLTNHDDCSPDDFSRQQVVNSAGFLFDMPRRFRLSVIPLKDSKLEMLSLGAFVTTC